MWSRAFLCTAGLFALGAGCTDARERFDDFDVVDASTVEIDAPLVSTIPDVTGEWFLAARPPLAEDRFLYFRATLVYEPVTENTGNLTFTAQPLNWETLEAVGEPIDGPVAVVGEDASFDWEINGVIPAEANSVTGSNANINGVVSGTILTEDFICGGLTGTAGALNLQGSQFGSRRITGAELPDAIHRCEDAPPAP